MSWPYVHICVLNGEFWASENRHPLSIPLNNLRCPLWNLISTQTHTHCGPQTMQAKPLRNEGKWNLLQLYHNTDTHRLNWVKTLISFIFFSTASDGKRAKLRHITALFFQEALLKRMFTFFSPPLPLFTHKSL